MANVRLEDIKKSFGNVKVLHGITLDIASGEFVSLLGASGCGKTTLLRAVAGLESVTSGSVAIDGQTVTELPPEKRDIAMMFQSYALLPHLSVSENVRFPLRMRGIGSREEQAERVKAALETVQLGHLAERKPRQLSGGQQQRVALARAIVSKPKVLLLDEPLSNLDARLREDMQVELIEIHKRLGLTTLFVTHDQEEALSLSDRVVLLNGGRVEQQGSPAEIYSRPATEFASNFLGSANIIPVTIESTDTGPVAVLADRQRLQLSQSEAVRGPARLVLRQEDLAIGKSGDIEGEVRTRVYLGARNRYVMVLAGQPVRVLSGNDHVFASGEAVSLSIDPARIRVIAD
ncbi:MULTISPECIES: ABC transporter ATP-binding protein [Hyphomicrobiales]|uniref:ABC transporter ATP-binding protein n=1 Tax=Hyphomicrobiales TaxID=356 RepID=UPI00036A5381|nr:MULTISPECIES: ABC transporter ATP-binding protein [Phyllobacteriaceae]MCX8569952.1 ABC transporter ATP-binding protein [Aminobacter sp. MET-1]